MSTPGTDHAGDDPAPNLTPLTRRRSILALATARTLNIAGAEVVFTARSYDLYHHTGSALWLSALLFAYFGGLTVGEPLGGVLGDRFDRRRVLVVASLLEAVVLSALVVVSAPVAVVAVTFLAALISSPFNSALPAAVPSLAGEEHVGWANGVVNAGMNLGLIVGPPIGGLLWDGAGAGWAFAAGVALILVAAAVVAAVPGRFAAETATATGGRFREGVRYVVADPILLAVVVGWMVLMAGLGVVLVAEVPLATGFGWGAIGYALLAVCWGAGAVAGSLLGRYVHTGMEPRIVVLGLTGLGLALAVIAITQQPVPVFIALAVGGLADAAGEVAGHSAVQRRTHDALRARAMAVLNTAGIGALAVSFLVAGPLLDELGIAGAYAASAATTLAAGLAVLVMLRRAPAVA